MSLIRQIPPDSIGAKLREESIRPEDVRLCTPTDIDRMGRYALRWLVVLDDRLLVLSEDSPSEVLFRLNFSDATEFRIAAAVGSGTLQARVDGMYVNVLRFTNRLSDIFQKVSRKLDRHLQGQPIVVYPEEEKDDRRCPTCDLRLQFPGDACPRCVRRGAVLMRMWDLMKPYRFMVLGMMTILLFGVGLDLVSPQLTKYLVDNVLPGNKEAAMALQNDPARIRESLAMLLKVVGILALVQICRMGVNIVNGRLGSAVGTAITCDTRGRLVEHLQKLSVSYYDRQQIGSLVGRVAYDTEALHGFVVQLTNGFLFQLVQVVGVGIMMFATLDAQLAMWTLLPAPLVIVGSVLFWRHVYPRHYRFWDASSKQAGMLSGTLSGIRVVKAFSQEDREIERFNAASRNLRSSRRGVDYATSTFNPIMALVFQLGGWVVWYVGGSGVLQGRMTLGSLMAFFGYLAMFYGPLGTLSHFTNWLTQFVTQAHRIFEILDTPEEIPDPPKPVEMRDVQGRIEFDGVTFGYARSAPVLQDLSLTIEPGEMIGVVGRSGSGKTTLVNLICRFYDVTEGSVKVDGVDVRHIRHQDLLRRIGVVLQEPFLFRGSIWQNVTYGKPHASVEEVIAAGKAANAHNFILRMPHGYDTWVGERGAGLSGGERQRVGIARVLLTDPRILILDEATSSVDAESEAAIQAALAELVKGRTTIAIAHRLSTLRNARRILVVDRGKIVETGSHEELLALDGAYARLVRLQGKTAPPTIDRLALAAETKEPVAADVEGPLPDIHSHHPRWLVPGQAFVHLGNLSALHVTIRDEGIYPGVFAVRCAPVAHSFRYISLRYTNEEKRDVEVGIIRDLSEWPAESQRLVTEALSQRYFVHTIESIDDIVQYTGYLNFTVETDLGPKDFMMRWQQHRAHDYGENGKMILDTDDNRYLIPDVNALPPRERRLFMKHIYW